MNTCQSSYTDVNRVRHLGAQGWITQTEIWILLKHMQTKAAS